MLARDRKREAARGLGMCSVRELFPVAASAFSDVGWLDLDGTEINPQMSVVEYKDEAGDLSNVLPSETSHKFTTHLAQVSQAEIDLIRNATGMDHALRYYGMINPFLFQYVCAELAKIVPNVPRNYKPGKQNIPLTAYFLKQDPAVLSIPEYYLIESMGQMYLDNLAFWISPRRKWNQGTSQLLDASGFAMHGTIGNNAVGSPVNPLWDVDLTNYPLLEAFLHCYTGVYGGNPELAYSSHGNSFAPGAGNMLIEGWIKNPAGGTGNASVIISQCSTPSSGLGFCFSVSSTGYLTVYLNDGTHTVTLADNANQISDTWVHVGLEINHVGTPFQKLYINGVVVWTLSASIINSLTNAAQPLMIGKCGSAYSYIDIGDLRIHTSPAPNDLDAADICAAHYAAEVGYY